MIYLGFGTVRQYKDSTYLVARIREQGFQEWPACYYDGLPLTNGTVVNLWQDGDRIRIVL
jgi:hypothetical protein